MRNLRPGEVNSLAQGTQLANRKADFEPRLSDSRACAPSQKWWKTWGCRKLRDVLCDQGWGCEKMQDEVRGRQGY